MQAQRQDPSTFSSGQNWSRTGYGAAMPAVPPLLAVSPGPSQVVSSSRRLSWEGMVLEKHVTLPGERRGAWITDPVITLLTGPRCRFEYRSGSDEFQACLARSGAMMITPSGRAPDLRWHTPAVLIHCALDQEWIRAETETLGIPPHSVARFHPKIRDLSIQRILVMLTAEMEAKQPSGMLYVTSLMQALVTRFVQLSSSSKPASTVPVSPLPPRILARVREKIEADLDAHLTITTLARETGYSRGHFLRMFHSATGLTPHQYVLDLRLRRAQEFLRQKGARIVDVALSCGFSSQSHMTSVFRQRLAMTPAEFRRSAQCHASPWNRGRPAVSTGSDPIASHHTGSRSLMECC